MVASFRHVHPSFATPVGSTRLWRYLQTPKFIEMLQSQSFWFLRSDLLGDPFEGSITAPSFKQIVEATHPELTGVGDADMRRRTVRSMYINCWHMNERESAAMWDLYAPHRDSVAIVTDFELLHGTLPHWVQLGTVKYIDYERDVFDLRNIFNPFLHKRSSFAHENELRAVVWDSTYATSEEGESEFTNKGWSIDQIAVRNSLKSGGSAIKVDLAAIISQIYVSPSSPSWYRDVVEKLCRTYGYDWPVVQSGLLEPALF